MECKHTQNIYDKYDEANLQASLKGENGDKKIIEFVLRSLPTKSEPTK